MEDRMYEIETNFQEVRLTICLKSNGHADYPWEISLTHADGMDFKDVSHAGWSAGVTVMSALLNFAKAYPLDPQGFAEGLVDGMNECLDDERRQREAELKKLHREVQDC